MHAVHDNRIETVKRLIAAFGSAEIAAFGPRPEEKIYDVTGGGISKEDVLKSIKEELELSFDELSHLAEMHPAWIVKALEGESPKVVGIILRWLPSKHVNYILEHIPKKMKLSLPKLVESFAVPGPILKLIKQRFEKKFSGLPVKNGREVKSFEDMAILRSDELERLFKDLGTHELAMAFHDVDETSMRVLLNRMNITAARGLQQRIKDVSADESALLKDAKYTILEVAMDQEDVERLLLELGLASFSKAMKSTDLFGSIQMKLEPSVAHIFKRYVEQNTGVSKLWQVRQRLVMERFGLLSRAGELAY